jgi:hypothetical protein
VAVGTNAQADQSVIDLARPSTDPDERADFFEHDAGCRPKDIGTLLLDTRAEFCASAVRKHLPGYYQHLAFAEQDGGVITASNIEAAGGGPGSISWVVNFRGRGKGIGAHGPPGGQDCTVWQ